MIMRYVNFLILSVIILGVNSCKQEEKISELNIIFLHHSTGRVIFKGRNYSFIDKVANKISDRLAAFLSSGDQIPQLLREYNDKYNKEYRIKEKTFPKSSPYGWNNYPYDYYNIWVKNAGASPFLKEPTLEILTKEYQIIIFKHCFPVSNIKVDKEFPDVNSDYKSISNYKLQYLALRDKLHQFPNTKFILFTGAAQVKSNITEDEAVRAKDFFNWVINDWDLAGDNIYLWDLYSLQTEGGLYFKNEYAESDYDSHPNKSFALRAGKLFFNRIIDIIENDGKITTLTGFTDSNLN